MIDRYVIRLTWKDDGIEYCEARIVTPNGNVVGRADYLSHMSKYQTENAAVIEVIKQLPSFTHLEIVRP